MRKRIKSQKTFLPFDPDNLDLFYQAPEILLQSEVNYKNASNVWSYGVILLEMLTQEPLFHASSFQQLIESIIDFTEIPSSSLLKEMQVSPKYGEIIMRIRGL